MYSIIEILRSSGIKTYWISNQPQWGFWGARTTLIAAGADDVYFQDNNKTFDVNNLPMTNKIKEAKKKNDYAIVDKKNRTIVVEDFAGYFNSYDSHLLDKIENTLQTENGPAVVFVHIMGSHVFYENRYPESFRYFSDDADKTFFGDKVDIKQTNAYDNSIRYTDYILDQIIRKLERKNKITSLLYFSDHGESVLLNASHDPAEYSSGHVDIPLFIWYSDSYQKVYKKTVALAKEHEKSPFMLDSLSQVIMDWVHISGSFYKPERSFLSDSFAASPRKTLDGTKDYDAETESYCSMVKAKTGIVMNSCR